MRRVIPWVAAIVHAIWLIAILASQPLEPYPGPAKEGELSFNSWHMQTSIMIASRNFHHDGRAMLLMLIDLPAIVITTLATWPFARSCDPVAMSYIAAALWLTRGSAWWYLLSGGRFGRPMNARV